MSINIEIKETYAVVELTHPDGSKETKNIDLMDLKKTFTENSTQVQTTPLLPGEYGTQKIISNGDRLQVFYLEPPTVRNVRYEGRTKIPYNPTFYKAIDIRARQKEEDETDEAYASYLEARYDEYQENLWETRRYYDNRHRIPMPRLLWVLDLRKNNGTGEYDTYDSKVYAMRQSVTTGEERLYKAPLGNVWIDNHRICWGNSTLRIPTLKAVQGVSALFFNAPFNSDLNYRVFNDNPHASNFAELLHYSLEAYDEGQTDADLLGFIERHMKQTNMTFNELTQRPF